MSEQSGLNTSPPRSRLPLILGVGLLLVAVVFATVVVTSRMTRGEEDPPPATPTATEDPSAPTTSGQTTGAASAAGADGCLGGVNPTKAIRKAQEEADLSAKGAAAFAATVNRWRSQYPSDPDYSTTAQQIMTEDAGTDLLTLQPVEAGPDDSAWATTDGARYRVSEFTPKSATVEIVMPAFLNAADQDEPAEVEGAARWRLVVVDNKWRVADMDPLEENQGRSEIRDNGLPFKGVC